MQVHKIDTTQRRDVRQFIRFPFELYQDCPQWVPPIVPGMRTALNRKRSPFYRYSDADFFVAVQGEKTVGRIAAIDNRLYNDYHRSQTAFFYYFDAVDDQQVTDALLNAAFDWAQRRGLTDILGPKGLLRFDAHGVLVDGFEHRPSVGVPYNFPYYDRLIKDAGFHKELDYYSGHITADYELPERLIRIADKIKQRRGFTIKTFRNKKEMWAFFPHALKIYLEAFKQVPGYYPVSEDEMRVLFERVVSIAYPDMVKLVMKGDEAVGFVISYPDVAAALQQCQGQLWPLGWIHLMRERKRTKWVTFNGVGLLPEYQGMGANAILYVELGKTLHDYQRFEHGDYVQVAESNLQSFGDASTMGFPMYKTHRIYRREL
ncbi:MAG: hypothetical protein JXA89_00935 [Anaerolineae bacterium]|nr:hypothetical protein [Anaerolineae bacterium]